MNKNTTEKTNLEQIEALKKKADIIMAVDGGMRIFGAPILGTLTVLGVNKKFLGEITGFKNHKTVAIAAESLLASNVYEGIMSSITKRLLGKIAAKIDMLAAEDVEDNYDEEIEECANCTSCCGECDDCEDEVTPLAAEDVDISTFKIIRVLFDTFEDTACNPIERHLIYDESKTSIDDVNAKIHTMALLVGEHTALDEDAWDGNPAPYTTSEDSIESHDAYEFLCKRAAYILETLKGITDIFVVEYDRAGIYNVNNIKHEYAQKEAGYEDKNIQVNITYQLPDEEGTTDNSLVDLEHCSPIDAASEVFNIFELIAGSENKVFSVEAVSVDDIVDEDVEESDDNCEDEIPVESENKENLGGNE